MDLGNILISVASLVVGSVIGAWYTEFIRRPLLAVTGSGSVHKGVHRYSVSVSNLPAFVGITIGSTALLGRRIHRGFRRGLTIDRNPAKQSRAVLVDRTSGRVLMGLHWLIHTEPRSYEATRSIAGGESATVMVFARLPSERSHYFAFQPDPQGPDGVRVPEEHVKFDGERDFELRVNYSNGRIARCDLDVRFDYQGNMHVEQRHSRGRTSALF